jgi:hypothetical protein
MDQQNPNKDHPLYNTKGRHDPVLAHGQHCQRWQTITEPEKVEKVSRAASIVDSTEKVARVHFAHEDIGHDPRCGEQEGLPYSRVTSRYVEYNEDRDGKDADLGSVTILIGCDPLVLCLQPRHVASFARRHTNLFP